MEAIIFIGIQATGKSSFYKERFFSTHIRINMDMLKTRHREKILLEACITAKQPFVVDNTNITVEQRARYIEAAKSAQFRIVGYYFRSSLKEALERNRPRNEKAVIPDIGIIGTHKRLQIPTYEEGFDQLFYVSLTPENQFVVEEWSHEV